jgi:hypothetical protein
VVEVYFLKPRPGRLDALVAAAARRFLMLERNGAVNTHLIRAVHGGSQTEMVMSVAEFADHETWARAIEAIDTSPEGQQLAAEFMGVDGPGDIAFSGLYVDVPLG